MRQVATSDYIQHNQHIPTGLEPFIQLLPAMQGNKTTVENIRMFQDGNYVFTHNIWRNARTFGFVTSGDMVSFNIFRVDNGKVAEHWDAMEPLVKVTASGRTQTDGPTTSTDADKTQANKELAVAMLTDITFGKNPSKLLDYYSADSYHQHNWRVKDGLDGVHEYRTFLHEQNNPFKYRTIEKVLGEGDFVFMACEGMWNNVSNAFYHLFRFSNGKNVEHWDVTQPVPVTGLANSNTMFRFPSGPSDAASISGPKHHLVPFVIFMCLLARLHQW